MIWTDRSLRLAPALLLGLTLTLGCAGCSLFAPQAHELDAPVERRAPPFDTTSDYMSFLQRLSAGNEAQKKRLFEQVSHAYDTAPSANAQLRMATALILLDPPMGNLTRGDDLLNDLLAPKAQLPPDLEALAVTLLGIASRQQSANQHSDALSAQLQDVQRKIKALTNIEQTIEQPAGPNK